MRILTQVKFFLLTACLSTACKSRSYNSEVESLAAKPQAKNVALLINASLLPKSIDRNSVSTAVETLNDADKVRFGRPVLYRDGRLRNIELAYGRPLIDAQDDINNMKIRLGTYGFANVNELDNPTPQQTYTRVQELAKALGTDSTLLVFFTGHGSASEFDFNGSSPGDALLEKAKNGGDVSTVPNERQVSFEKLVSVVEAARQNQKSFARLILAVDACESGKLVTMFLKEKPVAQPDRVVQDPVTGEYRQVPSNVNLRPYLSFESYRQVLFFTSSTSQQYSFSSGSGSYFTRMFSRTLDELSPNSAATIRQLVIGTRQKLEPFKQNPQVRAIPESILEETIR